jgi:hypothetical protein
VNKSPLARLTAIVCTTFALAMPLVPKTAHADLQCSATPQPLIEPSSTADKGGAGGTGQQADKGGTGGTGQQADKGGTGGTGQQADKGGTGGTGQQADKGGTGGTGTRADKGGVGGTGQQVDKGGVGGTGIVGVITGFASICINGLEVKYDRGTPVSRNGSPAQADHLALGQVVSVEAVGAGGDLRARKISILDAVVGPVSRVQGQELEVLGQRVRVGGEGTVAGERAGLKVGQVVRVSGERTAEGVIAATRVEPAAEPRASVVGIATAVDAKSFRIGNLRVERNERTRDVREGQEVLVVGEMAGGQLRPERAHIAPSLDFGRGVDRVVVEGYLARAKPLSRQLSIGTHAIETGSDTRYVGGNAGELQPDRRVRIEGRLAPDGGLRAERVEYRKEPLRSERGASSSGGARRGESRDGDGGGREGGQDSGGREGHGDDGGSGRDHSDQDKSGHDGSGRDRSDSSGHGGHGSDSGLDRSRPDRPNRSDRSHRDDRPDRSRDR